MNLKDVEDLAELGKLELTQEEKENLISDMDSILAYVKVIEEIDVPDIDITYEHRNVWREDVERDASGFSHDLIMAQFPDSRDGFLKVKKIL